MADIIIMEKPDWITYDDIHELIVKAHKVNIDKGIVMKTTKLEGEELKERIGVEGRCFVALDGEKLVGTSSYRILEKNEWYFKARHGVSK